MALNLHIWEKVLHDYLTNFMAEAQAGGFSIRVASFDQFRRDNLQTIGTAAIQAVTANAQRESMLIRIAEELRSSLQKLVGE